MEVPAGIPVKGVVDLFGQKYGEAIAAKNMEEKYLVMLNGRSLEKDQQFTSTVQDGDRITIFFPICGG
jgi:sulfur carrier protein ThiS